MQSIVLLICTQKDAPCYLIYSVKKEDTESTAVFKDKVYLTTEGRVTACLQLANAKPDCIFIAWFAATATTYKKFFYPLWH